MKEELLVLLDGVKTVAVTCRQFGDTGKGKIVDILALWAKIIGRGGGGDNCGHSIHVNGREIVVHLIPSGIMYPGKINIIGTGTVIYPKSLVTEMDHLLELGLDISGLRISYAAKLILPTQVLLDRLKETSAGKGKIGSTGKGIGPAYADHVGREGLVINDLLNPDIFRRKLIRHLEHKEALLKSFDRQLVRMAMEHEHLENGYYYDPHHIFNLEKIIEKYMAYAEKIRPHITDTDAFMRANLGKENILLEGAQGDLLSIDRGTYPFVTSSDCTVAGLAKGVGLKESDIDLSLGIIKAYQTRVGCGPMPSEHDRDKSDKWCNGGEANQRVECDLYGTADINDGDPFVQGIAIRQQGCEYGATTKRPRRIGWLDLPLLRYSLSFNSSDLIITKLDVLDRCEIIRLCIAHKYMGKPIHYAGRVIETGELLEIAIPDSEILSQCEPVYEEFIGWQQSIRDCRDYENLPRALKIILDYIEEMTGARFRIISVGPDREETIFVPQPELVSGK